MSVYRRDDFAFPPARGRRGVDFHADGTFVPQLIGRGDAPSPAPSGRWDNTGRLFMPPAGAAPGGAGRIVAVSDDRLEIAWEPT
ncbi:hypothetical protein ACWGID_30915 [Kribbella sp. NPDC054772]